jgi:cytochrome subunit of sulfide dehydrogenase
MNRTFAITVALACAVPAAALAQDAGGRNLAAGCAICHGTEGRPVTRDVLPLAGMPREHFVQQMRAFREGQRPATVMHQIAKGYSDTQIEAMAAWFAAQKR